MPYELVIFDFDGTLADSFQLFLDIGNQLAERYHFVPLDRDNLDELRALGARELLRRHRVSLWRLPFIARRARRLMGQNHGRMPLFPGVDAMLACLAESGIRLAILSSNSRDNVLAVLGSAAAHVTHFECGVPLFGKPARLRKLLRAAAVSRSRALLVGDECRDASAARQVGIAFGAVTWGYNSADALLAERPRELFRDVRDLCELARPARI